MGNTNNFGEPLDLQAPHIRGGSKIGYILSFTALSLSGLGWQSAMAQEDELVLEEIQVTASRLPEDVDTFPGTVSILGREDIETQRNVSPDLGAILGFSVPSLAVTSGTNLNRDQTLRGRSPVVLIDGIPISAPLRNSQQDIRSLASSTIENIEVIHGSSSLYGNGGAGGVINYVTRSPGDEDFRFEGEVSTQFSATHANESFANAWNGTILGRSGNFSYVAAATFEDFGLQFDSDGEGLPPAPGGSQPGLIQSQVSSLYGKVAYESNDLRVVGNVLRYDHKQDPSISIENGDVALGIPATYRDGRDPRETAGLSNANELYSISVYHQDVLGSALSAQLYSQKFESVFGLNLRRPSRENPSQSYIVTEKWGVRTDLDTPIPALDGNVVWGIDYARDETVQPFLSGEIWTPPIDLESVAVFAQLSVPFGENLDFRGGFRSEQNNVTVEDYTTYRDVSAVGGELDFNATVFNGGLTYSFNDNLSFFGGYSEGSSVQDIGRLLRDIREPTSVEGLNPEAVVVESMEFGVRYSTEIYDAEFAIYRNESEFGSQLIADPTDPSQFIALQEDQAIEGAELSFAVHLSESLTLAGTAAYIEGERDTNGDGDPDTELSNFFIPPVKITASVDWLPAERWRLRLQMVHSGSRNPFPGSEGNNVIGEGPNEPFTIFDAFGSYEIGAGAVTLGIQNLLNEDYFLRYGQSRNRSDAYAKGQGTTVRLAYKFEY